MSRLADVPSRSVSVLWRMLPRCWRCCPISAAAGGHAAAICIAMATYERKLRSSGVPPRVGSEAGAGGRAAAAQIVGEPRAQGQEAGCAQWQHTAARAAHPRQRPRAWPHRKQVLRHEDGYLFMCYGRKRKHLHTQKISFKHHALHTWYAPAHVVQ